MINCLPKNGEESRDRRRDEREKGLGMAVGEIVTASLDEWCLCLCVV